MTFRSDKYIPVLYRYFFSAIVSRALLFSFVFVALMEILALVEKMSAIFARHQGFQGVAYFCALKFPTLFEQSLPLAVLLGAIFFLVQVNQHSEIASLRAAGLSTMHLYRLMLPAALALAVLTLIIKNSVSPYASLAYLKWWNRTAPTETAATGELWIHAGPQIIHIGEIRNGGNLISSIDAFRHGEAYGLEEVTHADTATYSEGHWKFKGVTSWEQRGERFVPAVHTNSRRPINLPSPDSVLALQQTPPIASLPELRRAIKGSKPTSQSTITYEMAACSYFFLPIKLCIMILLALPVIYVPPRSGTKSLLPVASLGCGVFYLIGQGFCEALANAGTLPIFFSLVATPLIALSLMWTWLLKLEAG